VERHTHTAAHGSPRTYKREVAGSTPAEFAILVGMIRIEVRDGRIGRDPALVTEEGGELLASFDSPEPLDEGARLTLPDGTVVEVIGFQETFNDVHWTQVVSVGGVFDV
jgi:hypothetical protein